MNLTICLCFLEKRGEGHMSKLLHTMMETVGKIRRQCEYGQRKRPGGYVCV